MSNITFNGDKSQVTFLPSCCKQPLTLNLNSDDKTFVPNTDVFTSTTSVVPKDSTLEDTILKDPVDFYEKIQQRMKLHPHNKGMTPMPEFMPIVQYLVHHMLSNKVWNFLIENPIMLYEWYMAMMKIYPTTLEIDVDAKEYPYKKASDGAYPYQPTIEAIEVVLAFFDKMVRIIDSTHCEPYYHTDRYGHYPNAIKFDYRVIIIPTCKELTLKDLVRVRSVPIAFAGITLVSIFGDRHWQSPLEFWNHDMNHIRRMSNFSYLFLASKGVNALKGALVWYRKMDDYILELLSHTEEKETDSELDIAKKRMLAVIIFELLHETAIVPNRKILVQEFYREPGAPEPFEHVKLPGFDPQNLNTLLTSTGNLDSGFYFTMKNFQTLPKVTTIRYFLNVAPTISSNIYNKLFCCFYDDPNNPSDNILPVKYRTVEFVAEMVFYFFKQILGDDGPITYETILAWTGDRKGIERKFGYDDITKKYQVDRTKDLLMPF